MKLFTKNVEANLHATGATSRAFAEQGKSIAVQWQKAQAALTAAAIPIGGLLFSALQAAAREVEHFASTIETHMPQIRSEFETLAGPVVDLGRKLKDAAGSRSGIDALLAALAGYASFRGLTKLVSTVGGLDRKSTRLNSSHIQKSRMPSSA